MKYLFTLGLSLVMGISAIGQDQEITLKDIWKSSTFSQNYVYGLRSMNNGKNYTRIGRSEKGQSIEMYAYRNGKKVKDLLKPGAFPHRFGAYQFSADESKLLLATETEAIYRHSSKSVYYIYDLKKEEFERLSEGKQMFATFSPEANQVAFVRDNNLFVKDLNSGKETQITLDGEKNKIINGGTDWVYEEEFAFDKAFFWSPDGKKIAYYRFDETAVPEFSMDMFQGDLYPSQYRFKYPKAGETNSKVSIHVYTLESKSTSNVQSSLTGEDLYIPRIKWTQDPNLLCVQRLNRHQNKLEFIWVNTATGDENVVHTETDEAYVDVTDDLTFLKDGSGFILSSEKSGYNHLYRFDMNGNELNQITKGDFDVTSFYGVDAKEEYLYYASAETSPMQRQIYRVKLDGSQKESIVSTPGTNSANFSSGMRYFINTHSDANSPYTYTLHESDGSQKRVIEANEEIKERMAKFGLSKKEFFSFTTEDNIDLNGYLIKPKDFDPTKKYPVFMFVYGGPGSQMVTDSWGGSNYFWFQMLAQQGYIVACVDNRGTGARGRDFKKCTYQELGKLETQDQIQAAKYLGNQDYVDADRIGIFGWSYGGYMSSLCLTKGAEFFSLAIAVAPVTNWRYYDTIYTERYMRTPQENASGYDDNSPINHVEKMQGDYLLVHGSADDNVHYQNTMEMIRAMVDADVQYDLFIYPDKNHGIYGGNTRYHLYTKMTNFITENL